ncbi:MAG: hypothetical protein GTO02_20305, partial [Candidatus Dadabacteria bacterium]|nr:hypothetical protein [Candidatus Dadabacteria bacterium]
LDAKSGLQRIVTKYIDYAKHAASTNNFEKALKRLDKAEQITPGAESIQFTREEIKLQQAAYLAEQKAREEQQARLAREREKQLAEAEQKRLAEEEEAKRLADAEKQRLQAEIEQLKKQTEALKQSSVEQIDTRTTSENVAPAIVINIKGTDQ